MLVSIFIFLDLIIIGDFTLNFITHCLFVKLADILLLCLKLVLLMMIDDWMIFFRVEIYFINVYV
jgi:hypothetical protein